MKYYTAAEVAEILRIHERTIREYLRSGALKGYKIGDVWRIEESDLKAFLEARSNQKKDE